MSLSLPLYPLWLVDVGGSSLMILFSFLCVRLARSLRSRDPHNVVWTYLLWFSYSLALFAVSRSVGHIAKRVLLAADQPLLWDLLKPYSGAVNTLSFMVVASMTLFFERTWSIYRQIAGDRKILQDAHEKILFMNRNLENLVAERTRALMLSESKYREIFESSQDMIVVVRRDGSILELNPAGRALLRIDEGRLRGEGLNFSSCFGKEEDWKRLLENLDTRGQVSDVDVELQRSDGTFLPVVISGAVRRAAPDEERTLYFTVKDISRRKAAEEQLIQADKLASIGHLAAGVAHEVNNPLGLILGYTQLLLRSEEEGTQRYGDLKIIEKHARACKAVVGDLLNFARSTQTRKAPTQIHTVLERVLSVVRHHFELDRVSIERDWDANVPQLVLDAEKMGQVFMNLLMNAKQAIGKEGTVRIRTQYDQAARKVLVEVADDGCGIKAQHLYRIFDPFFTTKSTGEGTGLGLSIIYGIVKNHGGEILVESEEGRGATFTVVLPETSPGGSQEVQP